MTAEMTCRYCGKPGAFGGFCSAECADAYEREQEAMDDHFYGDDLPR